MNLGQWAVGHHEATTQLTERQRKLLEICLSGILCIDASKVEEVYTKDALTNFSGDEQCTAQYPDLKFYPSGIGVDLTINNVHVSDWKGF